VTKEKKFYNIDAWSIYFVGFTFVNFVVVVVVAVEGEGRRGHEDDGRDAKPPSGVSVRRRGRLAKVLRDRGRCHFAEWRVSEWKRNFLKIISSRNDSFALSFEFRLSKTRLKSTKGTFRTVHAVLRERERGTGMGGAGKRGRRT